jgi:hypothetical protein
VKAIWVIDKIRCWLSILWGLLPIGIIRTSNQSKLGTVGRPKLHVGHLTVVKSAGVFKLPYQFSTIPYIATAFFVITCHNQTCPRLSWLCEDYIVTLELYVLTIYNLPTIRGDHLPQPNQHQNPHIPDNWDFPQWHCVRRPRHLVWNGTSQPQIINSRRCKWNPQVNIPIERMKATFKCAILDLYSRSRAGGGDGGF